MRTSSGYVSDERLTFDAQGRATIVVYSTTANSATDSTRFTYAGLGAVLARERFALNSTNWETEEFRVDGLGNVRRTRTASRDFAPSKAELGTYGRRGALSKREAEPDGNYPPKMDKLVQGFDPDGHLTMSHHLVRDNSGNATTDTPTRNYYGADGKLRAVQRHNQGRGTWEEYRYDALGRRVMVIARLGGTTPGCIESGVQICNPLCTIGDCEHKTTWQVWDGARLIREERRPYPDGGTPSVRYGSVDYVHGIELDRPLAVNDGRLATARVLNPNWRGLFDASVTANGVGADCSVAMGSCAHIPWPAGHPVYARTVPWETAGGTPTFTWSGSLLLDQQDGTGNLYRRNRYYDPVGGRFTQEDPIGLGGGLNLYGFADGDPINFDDPFGLCPPCGATLHASRLEAEINRNVKRASAEMVLDMVGGRAGGTAKVARRLKDVQVTIRATREYARTLLRHLAEGKTLRPMRDRTTNRLKGVISTDESVVWRPKKGLDGVTDNIEKIEDGKPRLNVHIKP